MPEFGSQDKSTERLRAGDFSARTGLKGSSELYQLAQRFDEMADELQRNRRAAEEANREVAAINGYTELAMLEAADNPGLSAHLEVVARAGNRAVELALARMHIQTASFLLRISYPRCAPPAQKERQTLACSPESLSQFRLGSFRMFLHYRRFKCSALAMRLLTSWKLKSCGNSFPGRGYGGYDQWKIEEKAPRTLPRPGSVFFG